MNGRNRIQAAFALDGTPEIGAVIPYESIFIRDHWSALNERPWWVRVAPDHEVQFTWRQEIAELIGQDWFDLPSGSSRDVQDNVAIIEEEGCVYMVDQRDGTRNILTPPVISGWSHTGNASIHPTNPPDTPEEIDIWIKRWIVPGQNLESRFPDLPHNILNTWGENYYPMGYINAPLWSCYYMWGFEGLMTHIITHPDLVKYAVKSLTESTLQQIQDYAAIGALGLWLEDCMTDMINTEHFHTLNTPYLRIITEYARSMQLRTFHYFCGNPKGKWQDLLDTGADALALEESKKGFEINILDVVRKVEGKMVVLGNLDAVGILEHADDATLHAEIKRQLNAGKENNNRFIMSLGSPVTPDTAVTRVQHYLELAHILGRAT